MAVAVSWSIAAWARLRHSATRNGRRLAGDGGGTEARKLGSLPRGYLESTRAGNIGASAVWLKAPTPAFHSSNCRRKWLPVSMTNYLDVATCNKICYGCHNSKATVPAAALECFTLRRPHHSPYMAARTVAWYIHRQSFFVSHREPSGCHAKPTLRSS